MVRPILVLALALAAPVALAEPGHVQFRAVDGVEIELEGKSGVTRAGALVLRNIPPGARRFEAHREGFVPKFGVVIVEPEGITLKHLDAWQPLTTVKIDPPPRGHGTLIVETLPVEATILARRLGWSDKVEKGDAAFVARQLPAGRHKFTFCNESKCIDDWVEIPNSGVRKLLIDFEPGEVLDLTSEFVANWRAAAKRCSTGDRSACKLACEHDSELLPDVRSNACDVLNGIEDESVVRVSRGFFPPDSTCGIDAGAAPGFVSIESKDPVVVFLGASRLGETPIGKTQVPAGCHDVRAVDRAGDDHHLTIRVEPGEARHIRLTF